MGGGLPALDDLGGGAAGRGQVPFVADFVPQGLAFVEEAVHGVEHLVEVGSEEGLLKVFGHGWQEGGVAARGGCGGAETGELFLKFVAAPAQAAGELFGFLAAGAGAPQILLCGVELVGQPGQLLLSLLALVVLRPLMRCWRSTVSMLRAVTICWARLRSWVRRSLRSCAWVSCSWA